MSLIRLHLNRFGHVELSFINARLLRRVLQIVIQNGGPDYHTAYLQNREDVEKLIHDLPKRVGRDLREGWDVKIRMDPWEAARYFSYDAQTAFECGH